MADYKVGVSRTFVNYLSYLALAWIPSMSINKATSLVLKSGRFNVLHLITIYRDSQDLVYFRSLTIYIYFRDITPVSYSKRPKLPPRLIYCLCDKLTYT